MRIDDKHVLIAKFELSNSQKNWKTLALFCLGEAKGNKEKGKKLYKNLLKYYPKKKIVSYNFLGSLHTRVNPKKSKNDIINMLANTRLIWM